MFRKGILNIILHPILYLLNKIKIWRIERPENYWHLVFFNLSLCFLFLIIRCIILHKSKFRILLKPDIKHRNNVFNINILINVTPILLPEYIKSLDYSRKASSKHPIYMTSNSFNYISWIQFLIFVKSNLYSSIYFLHNPCFINS